MFYCMEPNNNAINYITRALTNQARVIFLSKIKIYRSFHAKSLLLMRVKFIVAAAMSLKGEYIVDCCLGDV